MTTLITAAKETMPDPDLEIRGRGREGGGAGGSLQNFFWDLRSSVWSKYKGRGRGGCRAPLDPPLNRKAPGLRCKFATKLMTCSPVLLSPGTD